MFFDVMESRKNVVINKAKDRVKNEVIRDIFLYLPVSTLEQSVRWYSRTMMMMMMIRNTASRNLFNIRGMSHMRMVSVKRIRDVVVS